MEMKEADLLCMFKCSDVKCNDVHTAVEQIRKVFEDN